MPDSEPAKTADFKAFLVEVGEGGGLERLTSGARARLFPSALHTLRRDLGEHGTILSPTLADQRGRNGLRRVYRVEQKDMVEFYTVSYDTNSFVDDVELLSEY